MVLFRSLKAGEVRNSDDLKMQTIQFFSRGGGGGGGGGGGRAPRSSSHLDESTVEGQLQGWLQRSGYHVNSLMSVAGSTSVVEDRSDDRRICVCIDGVGGSSLAEWCAHIKEQRGLERTGWTFVRLWSTNWLIAREECEQRLVRRPLRVLLGGRLD
jgi:hypothetical protein